MYMYLLLHLSNESKNISNFLLETGYEVMIYMYMYCNHFQGALKSVRP